VVAGWRIFLNIVIEFEEISETFLDGGFESCESVV